VYRRPESKLVCTAFLLFSGLFQKLLSGLQQALMLGGIRLRKGRQSSGAACGRFLPANADAA
jgi:hypothetical protein